jgi:hypothetical protein
VRELGFWNEYILIKNMRLCCVVWKNDVVFEPLGKREVCFRVLF